MNNDNNIFLTDNINSLFNKFVIPSALAMLITGIQGIVDGVFVGGIIGVNAMASVNIALPFLMIFMALGMVVSTGSQSQIGISLGKGDNQAAKDGFKSAFISLILIGAVISFFALLFSNEISIMLGANDALLGYTSDYIKALGVVIIPGMLSFLLGMLTRIIGKPNLFLYGSILSIVVNLVLNFLFIYVMELGTFGAGLATGLAYSSSLLIVTWDFLKRKTIINVFDGKFNLKILREICYNGSSEGVSSLSTAITTLLFNLAFMDLIGEKGVAAFTATSYIAQFGTMLMFGISDGIGSMISYNFGAEHFDRVKGILKISVKYAFGIGIVVFLVLMFGSGSLIDLFVKDDIEVRNIAIIGANIYAFAFLFNGFNIVVTAYFTAIGYAKESALVAILRGLVFIVIGIFTLPFVFDVNGIWMSIPVTELLTFVIALFMVRKSFDKMINESKLIRE